MEYVSHNCIPSLTSITYLLFTECIEKISIYNYKRLNNYS